MYTFKLLLTIIKIRHEKQKKECGQKSEHFQKVPDENYS